MNDQTVGTSGGGGPQFPQGPGQPQQFPGGPPPHFGPPQGPLPGPPRQPQFPPQGHPAAPSAWPLPRIAALIVVVAGLGTLIASLFSLYTAKVTPSSWDIPSSDVPSGSVSLGLGFYDTVPFQAPIIAAAIPLFMLIAGLTALPMVLQGRNQKPVLPAFFTLAATLVALVLMISGPLPGIKVTGQFARELKSETGYSDIGKLIDSFVPISPGVGLILALVFGILGAAAALYIYIAAERGNRGQGSVRPRGGGFQGAPQQRFPQSATPPQQGPAGAPTSGWQPPAGQNW